MSSSFRPVREEWGEPSSCFVAVDDLVQLLRRIADIVDIPSEQHTYADNVSVWIEDGNRFLDHVESRRFTPHSAADLTGLQAEALAPLVSNMKTLAQKWREAIGTHGELHFYVDTC